MFKIANSVVALLFFVILLSCRSEARNINASGDVNQVEASMDQVESKASDDPIEIEAPIDPKLVEEDKLGIENVENQVVTFDRNDKVEEPATNTVEPEIDPSTSVPDKTAPIAQQQEPLKVIEEEVDTEIIEDESVPSPSEPLEQSDPLESTQKTVEELPLADPSPVANIHDVWNGLLKKYVTPSGYVDYNAMKSESNKLDAYLTTLASNQPKDSDLSKEAMAYYINVYNAATVKLILDNYPVKSIKDINGGKPWNKVWIKLGAQEYSLNNIEHDILRPRFKDSRVHFAVNCASASCPKIANSAFYGNGLDAHLEKLTRDFVNDPNLNSIESNAVELSKIFQWYQGDFPDLIDFLNRYTEVKVKSSAKKTYKDYKWNLNGK